MKDLSIVHVFWFELSIFWTFLLKCISKFCWIVLSQTMTTFVPFFLWCSVCRETLFLILKERVLRFMATAMPRVPLSCQPSSTV